MTADPDSSDAPQLAADTRARLRAIPPLDAVVGEARRLGSTLMPEALARAARAELAAFRQHIQDGAGPSRDDIVQRVVRALLDLEQPRLRPVLNATGVIVHTNLGRAPVSEETAAAMLAAATHAVALEIEPETNDRGGRMREIAGLLRALTGAESALVVNNCASAVLLTLTATAPGKRVIVSRGEAVEIGGGFRVPDVLRQSGAILVDVGTTNRTYASDYAAATDDQTAAYLKVHPSNFRSFGFVHAPATAELATLARERDVLLLEDLGSGALIDTSRFGLAREPTIGDAIDAGVELVMASGDKLLGGPQAGIIAGNAKIVELAARHPLARAVRADKTTLAGVAATLRHYARGEAETRIPIWRMIAATESTLMRRAETLAAALAQRGIPAEAVPTRSTVGGGSLPGETLPSWGIAVRASDLDGVDALARRLRTGDPAVFGRIEDGRLILDQRTVLPEDDLALGDAVKRACQNCERDGAHES